MNLRRIIFMNKCKNCIYEWDKKNLPNLCGNLEKIEFKRTANFCEDYNLFGNCKDYKPRRIIEKILEYKWNKK